MTYPDIIRMIREHGLMTCIEAIAFFIGYFGEVDEELFLNILEAWQDGIISL